MIKKIAYILYWNDDKENGVIKKILDSVKTWKSPNVDNKIGSLR